MNLTYRLIDELHPHPLHVELYGKPSDNMEELNELAQDIKTNGMLHPLIVDQDDAIISGSRRWEAAKLLGWEDVPCDVMAFEDEPMRIRWLISNNTYRTKSNISKIKEAQVLESLYKITTKAKQEHKALDKEDVLSGIARIDGKVLARDKAGEAVGLSARTFVDGKKALKFADDLRKEGKVEEANAIEEKLETSISGAKQLAEKYKNKNKEPDPHEVLYWYVSHLEHIVTMINKRTKLLRNKTNSTTPAALTMFIRNIEAMADRIRTWYPNKMVDCPVCKGTMFVDGVECTNCIQGKVGAYVNIQPKVEEEDS